MTIWHRCTILNEHTRIESKLKLNPFVVIGHKELEGGCPVIGDYESLAN